MKLSGLVKTRSLAEKACDAGAVTIDGRTAKSASRVSIGSVVVLKKPSGGEVKFAVRVIPESRNVSRTDRELLFQLIGDGSTPCS
ncbi:MAG: S4 domain-containing protein [Desulfobacterales bacterium]|nr:S4 domain-containing protein [Desulfobacterales bacterium]